MVLVLVLVVIMFAVNTKGVMLLPQNVNNLVAQNAYVFILATGMLFCIMTGGNIDLSVGSVVCKNPTVYCNSGWYACVPWSFKRSFTGTDTGTNA